MSQTTDFDAIVIGSGITGGWAAKELTERGLETLVLERGRPLRHGPDYAGEHVPVWRYPLRTLPPRQLYDRDYPIQQQCIAFSETNRSFWNNDRENPYVFDPAKPFTWIRGDVTGGRSTMWGRQVYRWSDLDFEANRKDGHGVDWPIRYADIERWYDHVERFIGVSGEPLGLPHLPDGRFQPPMPMNVLERHIAREIRQAYPERLMTIGRTATLTRPLPGREACHYCGPCERGCTAGAYFSSLSSTLPAAEATGRLTLRNHAVVEGLDHDSGRIAGVRVIDSQTRRPTRYTGRLVFLCASTIASTQILLNSRSERYPDGLANDSGVLGHYLMDHTYLSGAVGAFAGFEEYYPYGERPTGIYIPRFRNLDRHDEAGFLRGYGYQGWASRATWRQMSLALPGFGASYKETLRQPGLWQMLLAGFGECLPEASNRMLLDDKLTDRFGIPQVRFEFAYGPNERAIKADITSEAEAMLKAAGAAQVIPVNVPTPGGLAIHEMGTARMGRDPATSVLNAFNQAHGIDNLFVTDGACMTSSSCVNPSLTYMALTARAVDHAAHRLADGQV